MWARHQILVKYTELDGVQEKTYYIGQYESMDEFPISYSPDFYSRQYYINDTFQNDSQE